MKKKSRDRAPIGILVSIVLLAGAVLLYRPAIDETETTRVTRETILPQREGQLTRTPQPLHPEVASLLEERRKLDETVWAREVMAQKYEETIVKYWDRMLRPDDDRYAVLADFPFESITLDAPGEAEELDWGIKQINFKGHWKTLDRDGWRDFLREMKDRGHDLKAIEFHQSSFDVDSDDNAVSVFNVLLNVANEEQNRRWTVQTKLRVQWTQETDEDGLYLPGDLKLYDTRILEREGATVFERRTIKTDVTLLTHPILQDLNRDGKSDILLPVDNKILWNRGNGQFDEEVLFAAPGKAPMVEVWTGTAADFTRDGYTDLIVTGKRKPAPGAASSKPESGVFLFRGNAQGRFTSSGQRVARLLST